MQQPRVPHVCRISWCDTSLSGTELNDGIQFAANVASRVMTTLIGKFESIFPNAKKPWYQTTNDEDAPK